MSNNLNKQLAKSIQMIELATKKMHEKRTGRKFDVNAKTTANGTIKVTVVAHNIDTEDQTSSLMAAQYMLNDMYINDVLIQYNLPMRKIKVDDFSLDWTNSYENNGSYTVLGELALIVNVELYKPYEDLISYQGDVITFHTTSDEYITLDCVECNITWHQAKVA
ncbi:hypothetical protein EDM57_04770 [Brevibacillus gelatini]|uniref:Uncharacterized protein n=1 Tax=Brevibacillus gelatini TaxID=1655277 RepID=A0A3M8B7V5_9BACL|nr:hypothetical protein [Brevibacillus gelatini]RNB59459.1 hypothetical protein EDM57_04770 [Brevibacillus gelatini]